MTRRLRVLLLFSASIAAAAWPRPAAAQAAKDTLSYELVSASLSRTAGRVGWLTIEFGKSMPARYVAAGLQTLPGAAEWTIEVRTISAPATVATIAVTSVFVRADPAQNRLVDIQPAAAVDPASAQVRVRLLEANFPEVILNQPAKQGATALYGPAKGKDDADVYFKGLVIGTPSSGPTYSIDAKGGYLRALGSNRRGSLGVTGTYVVDKASDVGPDSITTNAKYSKVFVWGPATGLIVDADVVGFEFNAANDTRNVRSSGLGQFVFRSARLGPKSYVTGDIVTGFEAGHNATNGVTADSLGGFWRTVFGGNGYLLLQGTPIAPRIDVTASWKVRVPAQDEPFTHRVDGAVITELSDEARRLVTVNAAFMISKALGFSVGYRHGSEPPAYKHVRHRAELGFVFKLKQIDKG